MATGKDANRDIKKVDEGHVAPKQVHGEGPAGANKKDDLGPSDRSDKAREAALSRDTDTGTDKTLEEQQKDNTATHVETTEPTPEGLTSTGFDPVEESARGVGGDRTIAPGGSAGPGSGPVDASGNILPPTNPERDEIRRKK